MNEIKIDKLIREKRRTITLIIDEEARLIVKAPYSSSDDYIKDLILRKSRWIINKKQQMLLKPKAKIKNFADGEELLFSGDTIILKRSDCSFAELKDGCLNIPVHNLCPPRDIIVDWYYRQALKIIPERVDFYVARLGLQRNRITITAAAKRWGSCGYRNSLSFTYKLIMAPLPIIDYVVVHELCHFTEKNHSPAFWNKVAQIIPDYKIKIKWLADNQETFKI